MANSSLYNGQNLDFTGNKNPYGLIQNAGKRKKSKRSKRSRTKISKSKRSRSKRTRKHRR
jgi:hypothetical protein